METGIEFFNRPLQGLFRIDPEDPSHVDQDKEEVPEFFSHVTPIPKGEGFPKLTELLLHLIQNP